MSLFSRTRRPRGSAARLALRGTSLFFVALLSWAGLLPGRAVVQAAPGQTPEPPPAEDIVSEIAQSDPAFDGIPGSVPFDVPADEVKTETINIENALIPVLERAGYDTRGGSFRRDESTGTVTYEDGDIEVRGRVRDGLLIITKRYEGGGQWLSGAPASAAPTGVAGPAPAATSAAPAAPAAPAPPPPTATVNIVPTDGQPADSVILGQTFQIQVTVPQDWSPGTTVDVVLTTPRGEPKTLTLHLIGSENGLARYGYGGLLNVAGMRNIRAVGSSIHYKGGDPNDPGTLALDLSNGEIVRVQLTGFRGPEAAPTDTIAVYDDEVQQGIARNNEVLNRFGNELIGQRNAIDSLSQRPDVTPAIRADLQAWKGQVDDKLKTLTTGRQSLAVLQTPAAQLLMGNRIIEDVRSDLGVLRIAPYPSDADVITDSLLFTGIAVAKATYKIAADLTMASQAYKFGQLWTTFWLNELDPHWSDPAYAGLRARLGTGPATNEFGQPITIADQRRAGLELGGGLILMFKFPKIVDWLADGRPMDIRLPGVRATTPPSLTRPVIPGVTGTGPKAAAPAGRTGANAADPNATFVDPGQTVLLGPGGRPLRPLSESAEDLDVSFVEARTRAEAVLGPQRTQQIIGDSPSTDPDTIYELNKAALLAQGEVRIVRPSEPLQDLSGDQAIAQLQTHQGFQKYVQRNIAARADDPFWHEMDLVRGASTRWRNLTDADVQWLGERYTADPAYFEKLPKRGVLYEDAAGTPIDDTFHPFLSEADSATLKNAFLARTEAAKAAGAPSAPKTGAATTGGRALPADRPVSGGQIGTAPAALNAGDTNATPGQAMPAPTTAGPNASSPSSTLPTATPPAGGGGGYPFMPPPDAPPGLRNVLPKPIPGPLDATSTGFLDPASFESAVQTVNAAMPDGERLDAVQVVIISVPASGKRSDATRPDRRFSLAQWAKGAVRGLFRPPFGPSPVSASLAMAPSWTASADRTSRAFITSLGRLGAEALQLHVAGADGGSPDLSFDGIVVEPLEQATQQQVQREMQRLVGGRPAARSLDAYCLEYERLPPPAGTAFRVANAERQRKFAPMRRILGASRRLEAAGLLKADSDAAGYGHAIRQWALWTQEQGFDREGFARAFVKQTRANMDKSGRKWTGEAEKVLLAAVPNRWRDITAVLREAGVSELVRPR